jgi:hypothetical protein
MEQIHVGNPKKCVCHSRSLPLERLQMKPDPIASNAEIAWVTLTRIGSVPDLHLERLVAIARARWRFVHPGDSFAVAGAGGNRAGRVRSAADGRRQLQPPQPVQAGPLDLPVLRSTAGRRPTDDRPRSAALAGRHFDLGKLCAGVHDVQQAQGRTVKRNCRFALNHELCDAERSCSMR